MDDKKLTLPLTLYVPATLKFALLAAFLGLMVKSAVFLRDSQLSVDGWLIMALFSFGLAFGILGVFFASWLLTESTMRCHVDVKGILIGKHPYKIRWDEIVEIRHVTEFILEGVGIFLRDPDGYRALDTRPFRWYRPLDSKSIGTPAFIQCNGFGIDAKSFASQLEEYLRTTRKAA